MNIKYNNIDAAQAHGLVTFSDVPAILEVSDSTGGTKALLQLTVGTGWTATSNNEWWITFQGNTISNVTEPKNATNKNFYIAQDAHSTAVSICNALRNCPTVTASFLVYVDNNKVICYAREIGPIDMTVTMTEGLSYITLTTVAGTADSSLVNNKISVDVYSYYNYVTTLQKNYHVGNCRFDMTPVLATMAEYGTTVPYEFQINALDESGTSTNLGSVTGNSVSVGYMVNQGDPFLTINSNIFIAQNVSRGKLRDAYNSSLLYVSADATTIPVSFYTTSSNDITATTTYRDSAFNTLTSSTQTKSIVDEDGSLHTITLDLNIPANCFYVDVQLNNLQKLRYDVIRPLKTSVDCQRIYWINSYGGQSFVDMVGERTIENTSETVTYNKNHLDYYTADINEKELVYNVDTKTTYTIKSHLMELDGTWQYFDLLQSPRAWTTINGETYLIIVESVSKQEQNNQGIFEMTVKFRISQPTSL